LQTDISDDKKRVLDFFNEALPQELACIQGCSKKKADNILKLRPFTGWIDLVRKSFSTFELDVTLLENISAFPYLFYSRQNLLSHEDI